MEKETEQFLLEKFDKLHDDMQFIINHLDKLEMDVLLTRQQTILRLLEDIRRLQRDPSRTLPS